MAEEAGRAGAEVAAWLGVQGRRTNQRRRCAQRPRRQRAAAHRRRRRDVGCRPRVRARGQPTFSRRRRVRTRAGAGARRALSALLLGQQPWRPATSPGRCPASASRRSALRRATACGPTRARSWAPTASDLGLPERRIMARRSGLIPAGGTLKRTTHRARDVGRRRSRARVAAHRRRASCRRCGWAGGRRSWRADWIDAGASILPPLWRARRRASRRSCGSGARSISRRRTGCGIWRSARRRFALSRRASIFIGAARSCDARSRASAATPSSKVKHERARILQSADRARARRRCIATAASYAAGSEIVYIAGQVGMQAGRNAARHRSASRRTRRSPTSLRVLARPRT